MKEEFYKTTPSHDNWARDWRALALTQVHHGSRLSDSCEGGEALGSVHPPAPATGKLIHNRVLVSGVVALAAGR